MPPKPSQPKQPKIIRFKLLALTLAEVAAVMACELLGAKMNEHLRDMLSKDDKPVFY